MLSREDPEDEAASLRAQRWWTQKSDWGEADS